MSLLWCARLFVHFLLADSLRKLWSDLFEIVGRCRERSVNHYGEECWISMYTSVKQWVHFLRCYAFLYWVLLPDSSSKLNSTGINMFSDVIGFNQKVQTPFCAQTSHRRVCHQIKYIWWQCSVARDIMFCPVPPCVRPKTLLTQYLAEYLTHFHRTYISDALWDRD